MMQQIATPSADIAALASVSTQQDGGDHGDSGFFRQLMQDNMSQRHGDSEQQQPGSASAQTAKAAPASSAAGKNTDETTDSTSNHAKSGQTDETAIKGQESNKAVEADTHQGHTSNQPGLTEQRQVAPAADDKIADKQPELDNTEFVPAAEQDQFVPEAMTDSEDIDWIALVEGIKGPFTDKQSKTDGLTVQPQPGQELNQDSIKLVDGKLVITDPELQASLDKLNKQLSNQAIELVDQAKPQSESDPLQQTSLTDDPEAALNAQLQITAGQGKGEAAVPGQGKGAEALKESPQLLQPVAATPSGDSPEVDGVRQLADQQQVADVPKATMLTGDMARQVSKETVTSQQVTATASTADLQSANTLVAEEVVTAEQTVAPSTKVPATEQATIVAAAVSRADVVSNIQKASQTPVNEEVLSRELQQVVEKVTLALNANTQPLADSAAINAEVTAMVKAGVENYRQQLMQGKDVNLDIKALIADAIANAAPQGKPGPELSDKATLSASQALNLSALATGVGEQGAEPVVMEKLQIREQGQIQLEAGRQLQQFNLHQDKAVNIAKAEGQQQMAEKVRWMVNARNMQAEIRLDPAELGSVQVKINLSGEAASVNFVVQSSQAREALEQAVPRLRDMLAEQGIELGQSSVQQDSKGAEQDGEQLAGNGQHNGNQHADPLAEQGDGRVLEQRITNGVLGGIDFYA